MPPFAGAAAGGSRWEAQLRMRGQSRASPPATRGWLGRCGRHPPQMRPWGPRRSACRRQTGSRREPTGPRWKAGGSGGGTRGRCSHDRPGGRRRGAVREATSHHRRAAAPGRRASWTARGSSPWPLPGGSREAGAPGEIPSLPRPPLPHPHRHAQRSCPARALRCRGVGSSH